MSLECIVPEKLVVSAVTWEIESKVRTALEGVTPPPGCPAGRLFVPERLQSNVIRWGHCSNVACHPGIGRIILVKQRFWWRAMAHDIREFVLACSVCARGKTSNRPPEGLLQPLSVPSRPWSHIALDFVTADVWSLRIPLPGVSNYHGLSTHITHYRCRPRASLRLSVV